MPTLPVREMGAHGVISDVLPWDLPSGAFSDARNVEFRDGAVQKSAGYLSVAAVLSSAAWMQLYDDGFSKQLVYASASDLWLMGSGTWTNVGTGFAASTEWHSVPFGTHCIFNNAIDAPVQKGPTDLVFAALPGWPATWTCNLIRAYKDFLVAAVVSENGVLVSNTLYWSDAAPPNELPGTWAPGGSSLAGFITIPGDGGEIVEMRPLGDSLIIYTQAGAYALTFTGQADAPMTLRRLPITGGAAARECVIQFENRHFVVGATRIYVHDTVSQAYPLESKTESRFYAQAGPRLPLTRVTSDQRNNDILVYYQTESATGLDRDRLMKWGTLDQCATFLDLPGVSCISLAFVPTDGTRWSGLGSAKWSDFGAIRWANLGGPRNTIGVFYLSPRALSLYRAEVGSLAAGQAFTGFAERIGIDLDQEGLKLGDRRAMVRHLYPQISGTGTVRIFVGYSNAPDTGILWKGPILLDLDGNPQRYRVDAIGHGRYLSWRIEHAESGSFRMSGMDVDVQQSYER